MILSKLRLVLSSGKSNPGNCSQSNCVWSSKPRAVLGFPGSPRAQPFKELMCCAESVRGSCYLQSTLLLESCQTSVYRISHISLRHIQDRWRTPFMTDPLSESWKRNKQKSCCRKQRQRNGKDSSLFTSCKWCSLLLDHCTDHHN